MLNTTNTETEIDFPSMVNRNLCSDLTYLLTNSIIDTSLNTKLQVMTLVKLYVSEILQNSNAKQKTMYLMFMVTCAKFLQKYNRR